MKVGPVNSAEGAPRPVEALKVIATKCWKLQHAVKGVNQVGGGSGTSHIHKHLAGRAQGNKRHRARVFIQRSRCQFISHNVEPSFKGELSDAGAVAALVAFGPAQFGSAGESIEQAA